MDEQHAVPQDITGFEFKLVGDMTLKQFGQLAFGAVMAYLFYASNWNPFIKWPLTIFFGFMGVALAFFPIEGRPLSVWIVNFFKAIYHPTYYIWEKNNSSSKVVSYTPAPIVASATQTKLHDWPKPVVEAVSSISVDQLQKLREEKVEAKAQEVVTPAANIITVDHLAKMREKKQTEKKVETPPVPPWASGATAQMRVADLPIGPKLTISLSEVPNVINGTVSDTRGAPMEGVVLVIKDKAGNSVRALKTNRVGQFIVSTPLENGNYFLDFEMPNYTFNVYEIALTGQIIKPLEIKGKYHD